MGWKLTECVTFLVFLWHGCRSFRLLLEQRHAQRARRWHRRVEWPWGVGPMWLATGLEEDGQSAHSADNTSEADKGRRRHRLSVCIALV